MNAAEWKWKEDLLMQRICELKDVPFYVNGVCCYGGGVDDLTAEAIRAVEAGDLVKAERLCEEAECKSLRRYDV